MKLICIKKKDDPLNRKESSVALLAINVMTTRERELFQHVKQAWWDPKNQKLVTNPRLPRE